MGTGSTLNMLMHNLLSVSTLCRNAYSVTFKPDRCEIHTPDKTIIPLTQDGRLYFVEGSATSDLRQTIHSKDAKTKAVEAANLARSNDFSFVGDSKKTNAMIKELQTEFNRQSSGFRKAPAMRYWKNTKSAQMHGMLHTCGT